MMHNTMELKTFINLKELRLLANHKTAVKETIISQN